MFKILTVSIFSVLSMALTIKVGVLAPEGTSWAKNLNEMAKEIQKATKGDVKIKYYFGGSQGDEPDVLRKIRVGQLQGGIFTGKTLGEINGDVRVIELPFTFFNDRKKAMSVVENMTPFFNEKFTENGFRNLGFFEIGIVYFVSSKETKSITDLGGVKIWSWEGDKLVSTMIDTMKLISVPLPITDVLSSLSTGVIDAAYAPPLGILSLQWNTKINYLVNFPLSYSIGAFLVNDKTWKTISEANKKIVDEISAKYISQVNLANEKDNADALEVLKSGGIKFIDYPKSDVEAGKKLRVEIVKKLKNNLFSAKALEKLESNLK